MSEKWYGDNRKLRIKVTVDPAGYERFEKPVEISICFSDYIGNGDAFDEKSIQVVETAEGKVVDKNVPFQFDKDRDYNEKTNAKGTLIFMMKGHTRADQVRNFEIYFSVKGNTFPDAVADPQVEVVDGLVYEGYESIRIKSKNAIYYYHKAGAGFASMIDKDGNDWISYHPWGGPDGKYRGIPNVVHPESEFHPGPGLEGDKSIIQSSGPLRARIFSETGDGKWACTWDIYPYYARLTVLKAGHPYWFLYEGTPAGKLDEETNYYVMSDGKRARASARFAHSLPLPKWIYFGDEGTERVLYLVNHQEDSVTDSYWPMENQMTVFGFGRNGLEKYLEKVPASFTIGFCEVCGYTETKRYIDSAFRDIKVTLGDVEARKGAV